MIKITIEDDHGNVDTHYQNDNAADIFIEKFLMTAHDPDRYTITTEGYDEFNGGVMRKLGEDLSKGDPVEFYNWYYENCVRKGRTVIDNLYNDFNCRLMHSALFGESKIALLYVEEDHNLYLRVGEKLTDRIGWGSPTLIQEGYAPSNIYVQSMSPEDPVFLIVCQTEGHAGVVYFVDSGVVSAPSQFSTGVATDMTALALPGVESEGPVFVVSYQDGDGVGYTKLGSCPYVGEPNFTWYNTWQHSVSDCYENRLCPAAYEGNVFSVFYRRDFKGYVRTADVDAGLEIIDQSAEFVCADTLCKNMQPTLVAPEGDTTVVLAYIDVLDSGRGVMCTGSLADPANPSFNPTHRAFFNTCGTQSITISHPRETMPDGYFSLGWIDGGDIRQTYFDLCAVYDMMPQSLAGRRIVDHFPGLEVSHHSFGYDGQMDMVMLFTIDKGYGEFSTYNIAVIDIAEILPIVGVMAEDGLEGETKRVHFFGEVIEFGGSDGTPYYLDRDLSVCHKSPFPFGVGLSLTKLLLTRNPER